MLSPIFLLSLLSSSLLLLLLALLATPAVVFADQIDCAATPTISLAPTNFYTITNINGCHLTLKGFTTQYIQFDEEISDHTTTIVIEDVTLTDARGIWFAGEIKAAASITVRDCVVDGVVDSRMVRLRQGVSNVSAFVVERNLLRWDRSDAPQTSDEILYTIVELNSDKWIRNSRVVFQDNRINFVKYKHKIPLLGSGEMINFNGIAFVDSPIVDCELVVRNNVMVVSGQSTKESMKVRLLRLGNLQGSNTSLLIENNYVSANFAPLKLFGVSGGKAGVLKQKGGIASGIRFITIHNNTMFVPNAWRAVDPLKSSPFDFYIADLQNSIGDVAGGFNITSNLLKTRAVVGGGAGKNRDAYILRVDNGVVDMPRSRLLVANNEMDVKMVYGSLSNIGKFVTSARFIRFKKNVSLGVLDVLNNSVKVVLRGKGQCIFEAVSFRKAVAAEDPAADPGAAVASYKMTVAGNTVSVAMESGVSYNRAIMVALREGTGSFPLDLRIENNDMSVLSVAPSLIGTKASNPVGNGEKMLPTSSLLFAGNAPIPAFSRSSLIMEENSLAVETQYIGADFTLFGLQTDAMVWLREKATLQYHVFVFARNSYSYHNSISKEKNAQQSAEMLVFAAGVAPSPSPDSQFLITDNVATVNITAHGRGRFLRINADPDATTDDPGLTNKNRKLTIRNNSFSYSDGAASTTPENSDLATDFAVLSSTGTFTHIELDSNVFAHQPGATDNIPECSLVAHGPLSGSFDASGMPALAPLLSVANNSFIIDASLGTCIAKMLRPQAPAASAVIRNFHTLLFRRNSLTVPRVDQGSTWSRVSFIGFRFYSIMNVGAVIVENTTVSVGAPKSMTKAHLNIHHAGRFMMGGVVFRAATRVQRVEVRSLFVGSHDNFGQIEKNGMEVNAVVFSTVANAVGSVELEDVVTNAHALTAATSAAGSLLAGRVLLVNCVWEGGGSLVIRRSTVAMRFANLGPPKLGTLVVSSVLALSRVWRSTHVTEKWTHNTAIDEITLVDCRMFLPDALLAPVVNASYSYSFVNISEQDSVQLPTNDDIDLYGELTSAGVAKELSPLARIRKVSVVGCRITHDPDLILSFAKMDIVPLMSFVAVLFPCRLDAVEVLPSSAAPTVKAQLIAGASPLPHLDSQDDAMEPARMFRVAVVYVRHPNASRIGSIDIHHFSWANAGSDKIDGQQPLQEGDDRASVVLRQFFLVLFGESLCAESQPEDFDIMDVGSGARNLLPPSHRGNDAATPVAPEMIRGGIRISISNVLVEMEPHDNDDSNREGDGQLSVQSILQTEMAAVRIAGGIIDDSVDRTKQQQQQRFRVEISIVNTTIGLEDWRYPDTEIQIPAMALRVVLVEILGVGARISRSNWRTDIVRVSVDSRHPHKNQPMLVTKDINNASGLVAAPVRIEGDAVHTWVEVREPSLTSGQDTIASIWNTRTDKEAARAMATQNTYRSCDGKVSLLPYGVFDLVACAFVSRPGKSSSVRCTADASSNSRCALLDNQFNTVEWDDKTTEPLIGGIIRFSAVEFVVPVAGVALHIEGLDLDRTTSSGNWGGAQDVSLAVLRESSTNVFHRYRSGDAAADAAWEAEYEAAGQSVFSDDDGGGAVAAMALAMLTENSYTLALMSLMWSYSGSDGAADGCGDFLDVIFNVSFLELSPLSRVGGPDPQQQAEESSFLYFDRILFKPELVCAQKHRNRPGEVAGATTTAHIAFATVSALPSHLEDAAARLPTRLPSRPPPPFSFSNARNQLSVIFDDILCDFRGSCALLYVDERARLRTSWDLSAVSFDVETTWGGEEELRSCLLGLGGPLALGGAAFAVGGGRFNFSMDMASEFVDPVYNYPFQPLAVVGANDPAIGFESTSARRRINEVYLESSGLGNATWRLLSCTLFELEPESTVEMLTMSVRNQLRIALQRANARVEDACRNTATRTRSAAGRSVTLSESAASASHSAPTDENTITLHRTSKTASRSLVPTLSGSLPDSISSSASITAASPSASFSHPRTESPRTGSLSGSGGTGTRSNSSTLTVRPICEPLLTIAVTTDSSRSSSGYDSGGGGGGGSSSSIDAGTFLRTGRISLLLNLRRRSPTGYTDVGPSDDLNPWSSFRGNSALRLDSTMFRVLPGPGTGGANITLVTVRRTSPTTIRASLFLSAAAIADAGITAYDDFSLRFVVSSETLACLLSDVDRRGNSTRVDETSGYVWIKSSKFLFTRSAPGLSAAFMRGAKTASSVAAFAAAVQGSPLAMLALQRSNGVMTALGCQRRSSEDGAFEDTQFPIITSVTQMQLPGLSPHLPFSAGVAIGNSLVIIGIALVCSGITMGLSLWKGKEKEGRQGKNRKTRRGGGGAEQHKIEFGLLGFHWQAKIAFPGLLLTPASLLTEGIVTGAFNVFVEAPRGGGGGTNNSTAGPLFAGIFGVSVLLVLTIYFLPKLLPPSKFRALAKYVPYSESALQRQRPGRTAQLGVKLLAFVARAIKPQGKWLNLREDERLRVKKQQNREARKKKQQEEQQQQQQQRKKRAPDSSSSDDDDGDAAALAEKREVLLFGKQAVKKKHKLKQQQSAMALRDFNDEVNGAQNDDFMENLLGAPAATTTTTQEQQEQWRLRNDKLNSALTRRYFVKRYGAIFDSRISRFYLADFFEFFMAVVISACVALSKTLTSICFEMNILICVCIACVFAVAVQGSFTVPLENWLNVGINGILLGIILCSNVAAFVPGSAVAERAEAAAEYLNSSLIIFIAFFSAFTFLIFAADFVARKKWCTLSKGRYGVQWLRRPLGRTVGVVSSASDDPVLMAVVVGGSGGGSSGGAGSADETELDQILVSRPSAAVAAERRGTAASNQTSKMSNNNTNIVLPKTNTPVEL